MPAAYAHYRFGKLLLPSLPEDVRRRIQRFRRMYDAGLQGPDFFFYFNPFLSTATGALGKTFHHQSGQEFFPTACRAASSEAAQAYLYGLLAHYCLDAACHPFVNRLARIGEAKHVALESELERFLLVKDGVASPHTFDAGNHLKLTRGECMSIAEFYPGATGGKVSRSFRLMRLSVRLLAHPNRKLQETILKNSVPGFLDHRIPEESTDALVPYVSELADLYRQALEQYPGLLQQLLSHLEHGEPLGQDFFPNFG